jgi:hypothetical protein
MQEGGTGMNKGKVMASHQGSIIKLPCNVGDTVWKNDCGSLCAYTITAFSLGECNGFIEEPVSKKEIILYISNLNGSFTESFPESEIGKTVFLTKQEAEAKIKKLSDKQNDRETIKGFRTEYVILKNKIKMKQCSVEYAQGYLYCLINMLVTDDGLYDEYSRAIDDIGVR